MTGYTAPDLALRSGVDKLTAAQLQPALTALAYRDGTSAIRSISAAASASLTLTTTTTDITGASVTFTVTGAAAFCIVTGHFNFEITATGASVATGSLSIDGVAQSAFAAKDLGQFDHQMVMQVWTSTLTAGSHTLKLRAGKSAAAATAAALLTNTVISVLLIDHR